ncbi:CG5849, partial [Drosophila busckii]
RPLRLPNDTYPLSYHLHISSNVHLRNWRFSGNTTIDIEIRQSTNEIVLHAKNLSDFQITVRRLESTRPEFEGELVDDLTHTFEPNDSFLIIHPLQKYVAFEAGQRYRLQILYTALMGTRPRGLYWMDYKDEANNSTVFVAATQSEPTYARLIFPCYDEPAFKSNFSIKLTHSSSLMAVSNMPVQKLENHGELTTTTFQTTPVMSTYLVAFVISNFESISETYRGVTQSVYATHHMLDKGRSALKNAVKAVATLEDYFGLSYTLPKLDHVALKRNHGSAMENWGLITYKEDCLMLQDTNDDHKRVKDMLMQNHEISHQWFGNLVSPEWWSYVWMNEGFATYFGYIITDLLYPKDKVMDMFIHDEADHAFSYSSFFDVRPMTSYVETEEDILNVFDIISYKRSACVIKMFHHALHQKTFVRGVSNYLRKFQYSVVNELDLFDALQSSVLEDQRFQGQPWLHKVRDILLSWAHSEWLPIVSVIRNYENDTITFRQQSIHSKSEHWWIPLNFASAKSPSFEHTHVDYFMPPLLQHTLSLEQLQLQLSGRDWLIVNKQQTGLYHVLYDTDNLQAIARQLQRNHSVIHPMNRAALFQDLAPLIERNEIDSVEVIFELLKYLQFEQHAMAWNQAANTIELLERNLFAANCHQLFKQFVRRLVTPIFLQLFQPEAEANQHFNHARTELLQIACKADLPECLEYTKNVTRDYLFKRISFQSEPDYYAMHDVMLCMGVRYLSNEHFIKIMDLLQITDRETSFFDDIIYALRCTQNQHHLQHYLNILITHNSSLMPERDSMLYLGYVYKTSMAARPVIWHFIDQNYKRLCHFPFFVQLFNDIADFIPQQQRANFSALRQNIKAYMKQEQLADVETLLPRDSNRVGRRLRSIEQFSEKFELKIDNWLRRELSEHKSDALALSALSPIGNGSNRSRGLLRAASELVSSAFAML